MGKFALIMIISIGGFNIMAVAESLSILTIGELQGNWKLIDIKSESVRNIGTNTLPEFTIKGQSIKEFDGCNKFWGRLDQIESNKPARIILAF